MTDNKIDQIADSLREVFQNLLRDFVKTKENREQLAKVLGKTPGHIKQMVYTGVGGMDSWAKAFAYYYKFDASTLKNLRNELKKKKPILESDRIWFSLRDEFGATEDELIYLASCAEAAIRIKRDIEKINSSTAKRRGPKPK